MAHHKNKQGRNNSNNNNHHNNGNNHNNNYNNSHPQNNYRGNNNNNNNNNNNGNYQGGPRGGNDGHHHNNNPNNGGNKKQVRFQNQQHGQRPNKTLDYYGMLDQWNQQSSSAQHGAQHVAQHVPHDGGYGLATNSNNHGGYNNTFFANPLARPGFGTTRFFSRCPWHFIYGIDGSGGDRVDSDGDVIMCTCNGDNMPPCILDLVTKQQATIARLESQINACARYQSQMASSLGC